MDIELYSVKDVFEAILFLLAIIVGGKFVGQVSTNIINSFNSTKNELSKRNTDETMKRFNPPSYRGLFKDF